ncbi:MAG: hypothetical protein ACFB0B_15500 [Thermonemataceae bacterium]
MKYIATLLIAVLLSQGVSYSQSRTNEAKATIQSKSTKLTEATGWAKNKTSGQWVSNQNIIHNEAARPAFASFLENFKWIQVWKVEHEGQTHTVLVQEKAAGYYKYPKIQKDWNAITKSEWIILNEDSLKGWLSELSKKTNEPICIRSEKYGDFSDRFSTLGGTKAYNETNILSRIKSDIEEEEDSRYASRFGYWVSAQNVDGKDVIRFRPLKSYYVSRYKKENELEDKYFEVEYSKFMNLFE